MGYLTTFTIYNDGCHLLKEAPAAFAEKLYEACLNHEVKDFGLRGFCNLVHVQKCRHADDHTMYVHMGNCVTEVNAYSQEFRDLLERHPAFADKLIKFISDELKHLHRLQQRAKARQAAATD